MPAQVSHDPPHVPKPDDPYSRVDYRRLIAWPERIRREAPFGPILTHFDEAAAYVLTARLVAWIS